MYQTFVNWLLLITQSSFFSPGLWLKVEAKNRILPKPTSTLQKPIKLTSTVLLLILSFGWLQIHLYLFLYFSHFCNMHYSFFYVYCLALDIIKGIPPTYASFFQSPFWLSSLSLLWSYFFYSLLGSLLLYLYFKDLRT